MRHASFRRTTVISLLVVLFLVTASSTVTNAATMYDYCQVPPYVIQSVPPTIQVVEDVSRSMQNFAYYDNFDNVLATANMCVSTSNRCRNYKPATTYYGYFNSDRWYGYATIGSTANTGRFIDNGVKSSAGGRAKGAFDWDGNFLNWLTMRRIDVLRKVLTGGKTRIVTNEGTGYTRLIGQGAIDYPTPIAGIYKQVSNASTYMPSAYGTGTVTFTFSTSADPPTFTVGSSPTGPFYIAVRVPSGPTGVLQDTVGTKARLGLSIFNSSTDGATVKVYPSRANSLLYAVDNVNNNPPNGNSTPLGSALWGTAGFFMQVPSGTTTSTTGPRYASGDYSVSSTTVNNDPLNYGTAVSGRWPTCAKGFVLLLTDGEPGGDAGIPTATSTYRVTDNAASSGFSCTNSGSVNTCAAASGTGYSFAAQTNTDTTGLGATSQLEDVAYWIHTNDLRNSGGTPNFGISNISGKQNLTLYIVQMFGRGQRLLQYAAINGGFVDSDNNNRPNLLSEWGYINPTDNSIVIKNFFDATDGQELEDSIKSAFTSMITRASSGTAASVLASGEGSGANLLQAIFYPSRIFTNDVVGWTGSLKNLWYYIDPFFSNASIREETAPADQILDLSSDRISEFYFDNVTQATRVRLYGDTNGDGVKDSTTPVANVSFENLGSLWEAGNKLALRDLSANQRTIFTVDPRSAYMHGGTSDTRLDFSVGNVSTLMPYLSVDNNTVDNTTTRRTALTTNLINWTHGTDISADDDADGINDYRSRAAEIGGVSVTWRLGDIISSTPRIVAGVPLGKYHATYKDLTYKAFTDCTAYKNRGMVFAGGNDGMLHAFKMGKMELSWTSPTQGEHEKAKVTDLDNTTHNTGDEVWAFIPKGALPYLKYMADPDYCHVYGADLSPYVFDASTGATSTGIDNTQYDATRTVDSWRTYLIGGMRYGGACKGSNVSCGTADNCVKTPIDGVGFSSYFALDVTDPADPIFLWEWSPTDNSLGFATTGPSIVRVSDNTVSKNGRWYVVFASGPTGPINAASMQFLGRSDQPLKLFVLDLVSGTLLRSIPTDRGNAFGGSLINSTADVDLDYQDDALYIPYVNKANTTAGDNTYISNTWNNGGVLRLLTKKSTDPSQWSLTKLVENVGAVTSSVVRQQNTNTNDMWVYFGTGRYFFEMPATDNTGAANFDDEYGLRRLVGVKDNCFKGASYAGYYNYACDNTAATGYVATPYTALRDVSNVANVATGAAINTEKGWFINLDKRGTYTYVGDTSRVFGSERVITDPLATSTGLVFFTTYKPYSDECALGGKSFLWALKYNTGGSGASALKGKGLMQVSTAAVEQFDLKSAFSSTSDASQYDSTGQSDLHKGGRRSGAIEGVPPTAQGLSILSPPPALNRVIHMREK